MIPRKQEIICNRPHHTERPCQVHEANLPAHPHQWAREKLPVQGSAVHVGNYTLLTFKHWHFGLIAPLSSLGPAPHQAASWIAEPLGELGFESCSYLNAHLKVWMGWGKCLLFVSCLVMQSFCHSHLQDMNYSLEIIRLALNKNLSGFQVPFRC